MNFYYDPIFGLIYSEVEVIEKGVFRWDYQKNGEVLWVKTMKGRFNILVTSQKITQLLKFF